MRRQGQPGQIVLGNHGTPDLALHKETEIWEVSAAGGIRVWHLSPQELELETDPGIYSLGFFPQWAAEMAAPGHGKLGPALRYHAAFLRYAAGVSAHVHSTPV
jgi:anthranilate phosphoribosyltransferase